MALFASLFFILFTHTAISRPSNEVNLDSHSSADLRLNTSKNTFKFSCPVGSYLSMSERHEREAQLTAAWEARLHKRSKFGYGQFSVGSGLVRLTRSLDILKPLLPWLNRASKKNEKNLTSFASVLSAYVGHRLSLLLLPVFIFRFLDRSCCELRGRSRVFSTKRSLLNSR
jgi:hypothetical protein